MSKKVRYLLPGASVAIPSLSILSFPTSMSIALSSGGSISMVTSRARDVQARRMAMLLVWHPWVSQRIGGYPPGMADGQIVRFKIGEAFPADDLLARWMTVCAMAMNDLLVVNQLLIPRLKDEIPSAPGEIFYLGRVAAGHLFEVATFLRKSDRIPAISEFVAGLDDDEAQAAYQELLQIGEGGSGKFHEQLKHARNKSFHYQELFRGDREVSRTGFDGDPETRIPTWKKGTHNPCHERRNTPMSCSIAAPGWSPSPAARFPT
jgi:hypothetical protein